MFEENITQGPGAGAASTYTFEILFMLVVAFLLGVWLGWILWNRYKQTADKLRFDLESLTATLNSVTAELNGLKTRLAVSEADNNNLRSQVDKLTGENKIFRDQLMETGEDLTETQARNRQLETELGLSFQPETPTPETIPLEINIPAETPAAAPADTPGENLAETAPAAESTETQTTVLVVDSGESHAEIPVDPAPPVTIPQAEEPAPPPPAAEVVIPVVEAPVAVVPAGSEKDDLTVVEGIGPKIQELLYQYGVKTYRQLAETDVARLKEILSEAGPQLAMHDPGTWPSQANLAANDQWDALKSIQGFLKGGKKPT